MCFSVVLLPYIYMIYMYRVYTKYYLTSACVKINPKTNFKMYDKFNEYIITYSHSCNKI